MENRSPALLVFTLGEECESRRRRLLPPPLSSLERSLHRTCLDETLAAGRAVGLRLEVSSPADLELPEDVRRRRQRGAGFGSRVRRAVAEAFGDGRGPVVLVGTDVPGLDERHLERTLEILDRDPNRVVIGPSTDGGFYLLAAARPLDEALAAVRWCCRSTLRSLRKALRQAGRPVVLLAALADLDQRSDLERWLASHDLRPRVWRRLRARLTALLAELRRPLDALTTPALLPAVAHVPHRRGPPARR